MNVRGKRDGHAASHIKPNARQMQTRWLPVGIGQGLDSQLSLTASGFLCYDRYPWLTRKVSESSRDVVFGEGSVDLLDVGTGQDVNVETVDDAAP